MTIGSMWKKFHVKASLSVCLPVCTQTNVIYRAILSWLTYYKNQKKEQECTSTLSKELMLVNYT